MKILKIKSNHNNLLLACFFLLIVIFSCSTSENYKLKQAFIYTIENSQCGDSIDISELTQFNWDKFYLIPTEYSAENIQRIIGFNFPCSTVPPMHNRYLFVNSKDRKANFFDLSYEEGFIFNCLEFDYLTPKSLILMPSKMSKESKARYYLNPIECPEKNYIKVKCECATH